MAIGSLPSLANRLRSLIRRRPAPLTPTQRLARLHERAEKGAGLTALMALPGWKVIEELKQVAQARVDLRLHAPDLKDDHWRASIEWRALEDFFKSLRQLVREGREAQTELEAPAHQRPTTEPS